MNGNGVSPFQGWVFKLILINVIVFALQIFTSGYEMIYSIGDFRSKTSAMTLYLGLIPALVTEKGFVWQLFTYMFLHSTREFFHLFFNMYLMLIFGAPIEHEWGSRKFLLYYFFCGTGAGIVIYIINLIIFYQTPGLMVTQENVVYFIPTIGASGAVFGLLLAFGILYPDLELLLFFVVPVKAKYLVVLYGLIELYLVLFGGNSNISHLGHLGGLGFGLLFFLISRKRGISFKGRLLKALVQRGLRENSVRERERADAMDGGNRKLMLDILDKVSRGGIDSLSDDEVQFVKHLDIMVDDRGEVCPEYDFNHHDDYCRQCDSLEVCFLREIRRHL